jgi:hypothetical protein
MSGSATGKEKNISISVPGFAACLEMSFEQKNNTHNTTKRDPHSLFLQTGNLPSSSCVSIRPHPFDEKPLKYSGIWENLCSHLPSSVPSILFRFS